jgi:hypothetical protein
MKIEVGKFYKTRSGFKARIYATDGKSDLPIHGAIFEYESWDIATWTLTGANLIGGQPFWADLIEEWIESPAPELKSK